MTETTDRPDISERYSRAINSSDLRVRERIQGDSDILMAAGWTGTLGTMLHRLSCEFGNIKGEHQLSAAESKRVRSLIHARFQAARLEDMRASHGPTFAGKHRKEAEALQSSLEGTELTAALLVFMHLKTLRETRNSLHNFALEIATKRGFDLGDRAVATLGTRAIAVWLDPNCHACGSTGKVGGYDGRPQTKCGACQGTGKARQSIGKDETERAFAGLLLSHMDRMSEVAAGRLTRRLRRG